MLTRKTVCGLESTDLCLIDIECVKGSIQGDFAGRSI